MTKEERAILIDQLDRSFMVLPTWAKTAVKHSMGAPEKHPETGKLFTSFREVIEAAADETLQILRDDFTSNGDMLPLEHVTDSPDCWCSPRIEYAGDIKMIIHNKGH